MITLLELTAIQFPLPLLVKVSVTFPDARSEGEKL